MRAGATGRVGRPVVEVLTAGGHVVVAMSRSSGVDVVTGDGLAEALAPREENLVDLVTCLVGRRGDAVKIEAASDPADPDRDLYETDALLPGPHATLAGPTFEEWLDSTS